MSRRVDDLIAGIEADDPEGFLGASEFVRAHMFRTAEGCIEPYASILAGALPTTDEILQLRHVLTAYLQRPEGRHVVSALSGLGKLGDTALAGLFRECLEKHLGKLKEHSGIVGQALVALNDCGQGAISGRSYSFNAVDKNIADAEAYLDKFGVRIPW